MMLTAAVAAITIVGSFDFASAKCKRDLDTTVLPFAQRGRIVPAAPAGLWVATVIVKAMPAEAVE